MLVRTKIRRISFPKKRTAVLPRVKREKSLPWREIAKDNIKKYTETGLMLRGGRHKAGLTQKELAEELGVKPHHISEMEHGKRSIGKKMAHRLAKVLKVSYKVFL